MRHRGSILLAVALVTWVAATAACLARASEDPVRDLRHPAVTGSAAVTAGWMLLAWAAMSCASKFEARSTKHETNPGDPPSSFVLRASNFEFWRVARWLWTLGLAALGVHLALAFWLAHGWSHADAVEHVREVGGSGAGIAVNYLFAAVWAADAAWWWSNPDHRSHRPRWVGIAVHGFLAFVVVNATVVFGPAERRPAYAAALALVAALAWTRPLPGRGAATD